MFFNINWIEILALTITALLFIGIAYLKKKNVGFSLLTIIGLALGIVVGYIFKGNLEYVAPIGTIYTRIILAIVAPLIIVSILSSVTSLKSIQKLKTTGVRSVFWLLSSTLISILLALGLGLLFGVGKNVGIAIDGVDVSSLDGKVVPFTEVIIDFFPTNIVKDIQNNKIIPIILFTGLIAIAYIVVSGRDEEKVLPFKKFVEAAKELIYTAVDFIIGLTPYAVLVLIANAVSKAANAKDSIVPLLLLLVVTYLVCMIHTFFINGLLITFVAKLNPIRFFKKIFPAQATAFTSQSSVGTLPVTINNLTKNIGVSDEVANFVAPLGTTIGMPGCAGIWPTLLAVFAINALNIDYSLVQYIVLIIVGLLVSLGTAGVPGTATVVATAVFTAVGLPIEVIILLYPISTIADMARTATNVTAAAVSATIVAKQENELDLDVFYDKVTKSVREKNKKIKELI